MYSDVWAIYAYYCISNTKKFITLQVFIQFTWFLCHCSLCFLLFKFLHWLCKCVPVNSQSSSCCMAFSWKIHILFSFYWICLIFVLLLILISVLHNSIHQLHKCMAMNTFLLRKCCIHAICWHNQYTGLKRIKFWF